MCFAQSRPIAKIASTCAATTTFVIEDPVESAKSEANSEASSFLLSRLIVWTFYGSSPQHPIRHLPHRPRRVIRSKPQRRRQLNIPPPQTNRPPLNRQIHHPLLPNPSPDPPRRHLQPNRVPLPRLKRKVVPRLIVRRIPPVDARNPHNIPAPPPGHQRRKRFPHTKRQTRKEVPPGPPHPLEPNLVVHLRKRPAPSHPGQRSPGRQNDLSSLLLHRPLPRKRSLPPLPCQRLPRPHLRLRRQSPCHNQAQQTRPSHASKSITRPRSDTRTQRTQRCASPRPRARSKLAPRPALTQTPPAPSTAKRRTPPGINFAQRHRAPDCGSRKPRSC